MTRLTGFASAICSTTMLWLAFEQASEEKVTIQSQDGFELHGRYYSADKPGPGILFVHQCNRTGPTTGFEPLAPTLLDKGFHLLMYDSRGFGESRNEQYSDYHAQMESIDRIVEKDIEAAYQFLISQPGVDPKRVGVVGASCGTWQAISLAQRHPEVKALVFLSGSYLGLEAAEAAYENIADRPVFAIYSENDRYGTPESMQAAFQTSRNESSKLMAYKGDLHGSPLLSHEAGLKEAIAIWFVSHLFSKSGNHQTGQL